MSLFNELKRRNVFRVGLAYLVGAWLLLQLTEVLSELLTLPEQIGPVVVALVAIGFPVALFFAWAFELTPEGVKRESEVDRNQSIAPVTGKKLNNAIIAMLALAVAYLLFDKFSGSAPEATATSDTAAVAQPAAAEPAAQATPTVTRQSIAVLPFENRSRLEDDEFFVEGIHDDLLTSLARIGSLKVISRTSVSKYTGSNKTIPEIATELGVATIMEGAVQRAGDTVRINVQLIDAQTDEHLWAEIFDRKLTTQNLFAIQSEISTAIAGALQATLSPREQQRLADIPTDNIAAYNAYLRGRQFMARRSAESLEAAVREFDRAVELDPDYTLAWVGLADMHYLLGQYSMRDSAALMTRRVSATERAMALDPELGEAHIALAQLRDDQGRQAEAEVAFRKGVELSPNYVSGRQWFGTFLSRRITRLEEALEHMDKAVALDPLSSIVQANRYDLLARIGDFDAAREQLQQLARSDPDFGPLYLRLGGFPFEAMMRLDEAIPNLQEGRRLDPGNPLNYWMEALAWIALGDLDSARSLRTRLEDINANHWSVVFVATIQQVFERQYAGAAEAAFPAVTGFNLGWVQVESAMLNGNYPLARSSLMDLIPGIVEPSQWGDLIELDPGKACVAGWILTRSGDRGLGRQLLEQAATFMAEIAPRHMSRPERLPLSMCLAALGDRQAALARLEAQLDLNYSFFSWYPLRMPMFDELRDEPRFIAVIARLEAERDAQRANVEHLQVEAGP